MDEAPEFHVAGNAALSVAEDVEGTHVSGEAVR